MQQFCKYGSVRGATGNRRPYRDPLLFGLSPIIIRALHHADRLLKGLARVRK